MKKINLKNQKMRLYVDGFPHPRIYWRKGKGTKSPSVLIKCGDCDNKVEIYYGYSPKEIKSRATNNILDIEINGVLASISFWKALFKKIGLYN